MMPLRLDPRVPHPMTRFALFILTAALLLGTPGAAHAQGHFFKDNVTKMIRKAGVHVNASFRAPTDSDLRAGGSYGLSVGLSPGDTNGWRYPVALGFFNEHLRGRNGDDFARLRSRAILAGIGYGWHFGKLSTGASMQVGYSDYALRPEGNALAALELLDGTVTLNAGDSWLLRPQIKAEYYLTRKFTVRVSGDYVLSHPEIIVTTPAGRLTNSWDASNFHANVGIGVYPFHK